MNNNNSGNTGTVFTLPATPIVVTPQQVPVLNNGQWITFNFGPICSEINSESCSENEKVSEGCTCKKCKEFNKYAEPPKDGKDFICYGCRMSW